MTLFFSKCSLGSMPPNPALSAVVLSLYKKTPPYGAPIRHPLPHSKCTVTIIIVLYIIKINYLLILYIEKWTKCDQTIHQNTSNCIIFFINFFGGVSPGPGPLTIRHAVVIMEACRKFCRGVQLRKWKSLPNGEKCHKRQS